MPIPGVTGGTAAAARGGCGAEGGRPRGVSLPVLAVQPALGGGKPGGVRKSRSGPRRAAVLIAVNALMAGHIILWVATGMRRTLSPVEPSEGMYTLERGTINAGFIFFALALLATLVFGRFFCGWGCHIVALQDLCAWMMKRAGVKPKPFRSRLLVFVPLLLGLYMFVWPTFVREVVRPVSGDWWAAVAPYVGEVGARPGITWELTKEKFWETFPAWYVAVPFLLVCGFGAVYFLGAKGFCTYGCPYGGFFGPLDRAAPGRILVTDACEHCGHCTSVCTSNVRVHEEVRDFGMVVDPGCMKCMDCVSVCPNDALYFGFARPPLLSPKKSPAKRRLADAPLLAEVGLFGIGFVLFFGFRDMFHQVPMLMAVGMAGMGAFLAWKLWEMLRLPSVRVQSVQLKLKGRWKGAGVAYAALTVLVLGAGAWGAAVNGRAYAGEVLLGKITVRREQLMTPGFRVPEEQRALAARALAHLRAASRPSEGGWGWQGSVKTVGYRALAAWVAGDLAEAERLIGETVELSMAHGERPAPDAVASLGPVMSQRGAGAPEIIARYRGLIARAPGSADARLTLAQVLIAVGDAAGAAEQLAAAVEAEPLNARTCYAAGSMLVEPLGRPELAVTAFERVLAVEPGRAEAHWGAGVCLVAIGRAAEGERAMREAVRLSPHPAPYIQVLGGLLRSQGRGAEASELERGANNRDPGVLSPAPR
ncbi:MAG: tetratricopeptide repeat protein [Phycisphaerales bacterium]